MKTSDPLRVVVVGPPLDASGGIGRVMSYALAVLPEGIRVATLDTRGHWRNPYRAVLPLVVSCGALLLGALRRRVDVVHVNISAHGSAVRKSVVVRACRLARIPVVIHLHASSFPEFFEPLPDWAKRRIRRTFTLAESVIVLSRTWARYVGTTLGVPLDRITVLPNATPGTTVAIGRRAGEPLRIVFLGRLGPRKGLPELLSALGDASLRSRSWTATLAGDGEVAAYQARVAELGLDDRVCLPGWVDTEQVRALLTRAHVLVLVSYAEGLPMSVVEAFAAGVPVISSTVGGLAELVRHEQNGLVVGRGDVTGLVGSLIRLHDDEPFRVRLAADARRTWQEGHSIDQYVRRLAVIWREAAGRSPLPARDAHSPLVVGA